MGHGITGPRLPSVGDAAEPEGATVIIVGLGLLFVISVALFGLGNVGKFLGGSVVVVMALGSLLLWLAG